jgi:hypothetical protein
VPVCTFLPLVGTTPTNLALNLATSTSYYYVLVVNLALLEYLYTTGYFKTISIIAHTAVALRPLKIVEPYLVEQERMANAQLLRYGSKHLEQNS